MGDDAEAAKIAAARYAVDRFVRSGQRIALGTGSTSAAAVRILAERHPRSGLDCVASSVATERLATSLGLPIRPLRGDDRFDLMLDGADEVSPALDLTKGGGGALLREKLLARLADQVVILVDPTKLVRSLGERFPIPVEVVPFAVPVVERQIRDLGYAVKRRALPHSPDAYLTDNGNEILDLTPRTPVSSPADAEAGLKRVTGVVETGIFVGLADRVIVGRPDGSAEELRRAAPRPR